MMYHGWTDNALRCCAARIKALRHYERFSWAHYRIERERETLGALFDMTLEHNVRAYLAAMD